MMRKLSGTEEHLTEIQSRIDKWNSFVRELPVPGEFVPAVSSGRLELLKLAQPHALSTEECAVLYQLIGGLLETNQALQQHAALIANMALEVQRGIGGMESLSGRLAAYAGYKEPHEEGSDS
jgi:hypothetical protein